MNHKHNQNLNERRNVHYKRNIKMHSCNRCCQWKAISVTYSECTSVTLGIQHAKCICHIDYLIKGTFFGKKLLNIKCVFWFSLKLLSETFLILRTIQWDCHKCTQIFMLSTYYSCHNNETWIFLTGFQKIVKHQISWKSVQNGATLFHAGGWITDMTKLAVALPSFVNVPKHIIQTVKPCQRRQVLTSFKREL